MEIGPRQGAAVTALLAEMGLTDLKVLPDWDGRDSRGDGARLSRTRHSDDRFPPIAVGIRLPFA